MDVTTFATSPFRGWAAARAAVETLNPPSLLPVLVRGIFSHMHENNGVFIGGATHNCVNHHVLASMLLRTWVDSGRATPACQLAGDDLCTEIQSLLRELNERSHALLSPGYQTPVTPGSRAAIERMTRGLWFHSLLMQNRQRVSKFEIARAWRLLHEHWPTLQKDHSEELAGQIERPFSTVFDSIELAFAVELAVFHAQGWVPDAAALFANTSFSGQISQILDWYVPAAVDVVGTWDVIERFPESGMIGPFHDAPVVRVDGNALISPDPGLVLSGMADRIIRRSITQYADENDSIREAASTMLGYVFEYYVAELLEHSAPVSASEMFVPEFELDDGSRSPDGFLVSDNFVLIAEAKATRLPRPIEACANVDGLLAWLRKLTGERPDRRSPMEQGFRFIKKWNNREGGIVERLGAFPGLENLMYVIVSLEDVSPVIQWRPFRNELWQPWLDPRCVPLDERMVFISIKDLEAAAVVQRGLHSTSPTNLSDLINPWFQAWLDDSTFGVNAQSMQMRGPLASFLAEIHPAHCGGMPEFLHASLQEAFEQTAEMTFG